MKKLSFLFLYFTFDYLSKVFLFSTTTRITCKNMRSVMDTLFFSYQKMDFCTYICIELYRRM